MSKPDPHITANLLSNLLDQKAEFHETGAGSLGAGRKASSEAASKPSAPRSSKLGPSRKAPGPGHMRSSPRGK